MMNYKIDFDTKTVICTASFMKKAGTYGSNEYRELLNLRRDLADFTFKTAEKKTTSSDYKNLTYKHMAEYIQATYSDNDEAKKSALAELDKMKGISKVQPNPYKFVCTWFLGKYPDVRKEKDEKKEEEKGN